MIAVLIGQGWSILDPGSPGVISNDELHIRHLGLQRLLYEGLVTSFLIYTMITFALLLERV